MKRVKPPHPGRALMMRKRLAEAQALLYAPTDAHAAERLTEEWLAGVELGWVKPPQLPLPLQGQK